jgi:hypothetical protein
VEPDLARHYHVLGDRADDIAVPASVDAHGGLTGPEHGIGKRIPSTFNI